MTRTVPTSRKSIRSSGTCLQLDGGTSVVVKASQTAYNLTNFSVGFYLLSSTLTTGLCYFAEGNSAATNQIFRICNDTTSSTSGKLCYYVRDDANALKAQLLTSRRVIDGQIHRVLFTDAGGVVNSKWTECWTGHFRRRTRAARSLLIGPPLAL